MKLNFFELFLDDGTLREEIRAKPPQRGAIVLTRRGRVIGPLLKNVNEFSDFYAQDYFLTYESWDEKGRPSYNDEIVALTDFSEFSDVVEVRHFLDVMGSIRPTSAFSYSKKAPSEGDIVLLRSGLIFGPVKYEEYEDFYYCPGCALSWDVYGGNRESKHDIIYALSPSKL